MGANDHARCGFFGRKARAERKPAADSLRDPHDVGGDAFELMGKQPARSPHPALDFVEDQQNAVLIAQFSQLTEKPLRHGLDSAFALDRLDHHGSRLVIDGILDRFEIAEWNLRESRQQRAKTVDELAAAGSRDHSERSSVEGSIKGDDAMPFGLAVLGKVLPRHLDATLHRFRAGIREEHRVCKGLFDQLVGKRQLIRNVVKIGRVPKGFGLMLQRLHQPGVGVAKAVHCNPCPEIEITLPVAVNQPCPFASGKHDACPGIGRQNRWYHRSIPWFAAIVRRHTGPRRQVNQEFFFRIINSQQTSPALMANIEPDWSRFIHASR